MIPRKHFFITIILAILDASFAKSMGPALSDMEPLPLAILLGDGGIEHTKTVQRLLAKGEDPNAKDEFNDPILLRAAGYGMKAIVSALIDAGADINAQKTHGITALEAAASHGHVNVVHVLLKAGAHAGRALRYAFLNKQKEIARILLATGAAPLKANDTLWDTITEAQVAAQNSFGYCESLLPEKFIPMQRTIVQQRQEALRRFSTFLKQGLRQQAGVVPYLEALIHDMADTPHEQRPQRKNEQHPQC